MINSASSQSKLHAVLAAAKRRVHRLRSRSHRRCRSRVAYANRGFVPTPSRLVWRSVARCVHSVGLRPNIALNRTRRVRVFFFPASVAAGRLA